MVRLEVIGLVHKIRPMRSCVIPIFMARGGKKGPMTAISMEAIILQKMRRVKSVLCFINRFLPGTLK